MIFSLILSVTFLLLSIIHFNWALGGEFGFAVSLPTKVAGERILNPKKIDCVMVGFGLLAFCLFYLLKSGFITISLPDWVMTLGTWVIPCIFLLRAIGDFRYVGFFKRIKNTSFAKMDTKFFSPLFLIICILGIIVLPDL